MSGSTEILREYLLAIGYKVDESSERKFDRSLLKFDFSVVGLGKKMLATGATAQVMVGLFARSMERLYYSSKRAESAADSLQGLEYAGRQVGLGAAPVDPQPEARPVRPERLEL